VKSIDLEKLGGYENPKYTKDSKEILDAKNILNKYVSTEITYKFGNEIEHLEGSVIKSWIKIDENLKVEISEKRIRDYIDGLASLYNTVGNTREFNTAYGKKIYVYGGYYGFRIDKEEEFESLKENIENGEVLDKEPIYAQKGVVRGKDDIGDTYVEISLNKQYVWFHKDGKIVAQGDMVSGDLSKGYKTAIGTYMLTYKEKSATLKGENYTSEVKYWMPFNGNIGLHDASWRNSFGGEIYKSNGSHGCVNLAEYTAKKIFDEIEEGTPIVCYYD
ncbi:MAG: L,D-transpeptidase family protein, partial [Clostridium sp.]